MIRHLLNFDINIVMNVDYFLNSRKMTRANGSWKCARTSLSSQSNKKVALEDVVEPSSEVTNFESFVQDNFMKKGVKLTEEEEKMVQEAIERTFKENQDSGVYSDESDDSSDDKEYEEENDVFT